jgi:hypothetical protein
MGWPAPTPPTFGESSRAHTLLLWLLWPRQPHRVAERQPCRGVNSLHPHPYGPHTPAHLCIMAVGHRSTRKPPHLFWPEAIAARWSCGPHVTPASNRRRRCRAGVSHAPTARALRRCAAYVAPTSSLLPILLCLPQPDHFLLAGSAGLGLPTVTKFARRAYTIDSPTVPTQGGSVGRPAPTHANFRRKFSCTYSPPITPITPMAASATSHPQSVSLCRRLCQNWRGLFCVICCKTYRKASTFSSRGFVLS